MGIHWERLYTPETLAKMTPEQVQRSEQHIRHIIENYRDNWQSTADDEQIAALEQVLNRIIQYR